jgi:CBS domain-containing protein
MTLQEAVGQGISLISPFICPPETAVQDVIDQCEDHPVLIVSAHNNQLLGIATAFDVL